MNHLYMFFPIHNKRACLNFLQAHIKELTSHFSKFLSSAMLLVLIVGNEVQHFGGFQSTVTPSLEFG